jgi:hypothetical protein
MKLIHALILLLGAFLISVSAASQDTAVPPPEVEAEAQDTAGAWLETHDAEPTLLTRAAVWWQGAGDADRLAVQAAAEAERNIDDEIGTTVPPAWYLDEVEAQRP